MGRGRPARVASGVRRLRLRRADLPGESVATDYAVLHDGRVDGYLPPGEYRFEEAVSVRPSDAETVDAVSFTWGFSLAVEDPE